MKFYLRLYENIVPSVGEIVQGLVREIKSFGSYVELYEYGNIESMLLFSEISRKKIKFIKKFVKEGNKEILVVIRTFPEKGYIDVSKKQITQNEMNSMSYKSNFNRIFLSLLNDLKRIKKLSIEDFNIRLSWIISRKFNHPTSGFLKLFNNDANFFKSLDYKKDEYIRILNYLKTRIHLKIWKIEVQFQFLSFEVDGLDKIKKINEYLKIFNSLNSGRIRINSSPNYSLVVETKSYKNALNEIKQFFLKMKFFIANLKFKLFILRIIIA
mmetsp:Transcript_3195/g.10806  ORF Transcript_3195/g.10806 Transcript_3195/m.10806 type:complete len:269 (-) Transcript_3195:4256-5062(-)